MSRTLLAVMAVLALVCAAAATENGVHFSVGDSEQAFLNRLHSPDTLQHARALEAVFIELDTNADGMLDSEEVTGLEAAGKLNAHEAILLKAFDLDGDDSLSHAELTLAPHTLQMLQTEESIQPSAEEQLAAQAFEGTETPAPRRLKSRAAAMEESSDASFAEVSASVPGSGGRSGRSAKGGKRGNAPLPVSKFGVPSVADEECVMCQYFVQRMQLGVSARLENGPSDAPAAGAPDGGEGLAGATAAAQKNLKVRNTNSQLQKKPGGRGIVRIVSEDVMQQLCAVDRMPLLFNPYCSAFVEANAVNAIRKGIFFNIPTVEVCSQAALCRDDSYLNTNAAVHATKTSLFLNGQRGICGMLGGSRDRPNSREGQLIAAVCQAHGAVFGA
jgi:hypothetical protein